MMTLKEDVEYLKERVRQMEIEMQRMERDLAYLLREHGKRYYPWNDRPPYTLMGKDKPIGATTLPEPVGPMKKYSPPRYNEKRGSVE
jgi:hypothetical protein